MTLSNKLSNRSSKGTARLRRSQVLPQPLFKKWAGWAQCSDSDALLLACVYVGDNSNMTLYVDDHTCFTLLTFRYKFLAPTNLPASAFPRLADRYFCDHCGRNVTKHRRDTYISAVRSTSRVPPNGAIWVFGIDGGAFETRFGSRRSLMRYREHMFWRHKATSFRHKATSFRHKATSFRHKAS